MRCILRVCWAGEPILDNARWWEVKAYVPDHYHPLIKDVGVAILIIKKMASDILMYFLVSLQ
jgi:hypothetical protein